MDKDQLWARMAELLRLKAEACDRQDGKEFKRLDDEYKRVKLAWKEAK